MVLTLYKTDGCAPAYAVLMVIKAANIPDVEYVEVEVLGGEHHKNDDLKMNPQHTVPMLRDDDFYVWDSHAIAVYLLTKYSNNKTLYPTDPKRRATIDQRLHFDSGILFPCLYEAVTNVVNKGHRSISPESFKKIRLAYDLLEKILTKPWITGDEVTLADICCVATISVLNELLLVDPKTFPNISAWFQLCKEQEFYKINETGVAQLSAIMKNRMD